MSIVGTTTKVRCPSGMPFEKSSRGRGCGGTIQVTRKLIREMASVDAGTNAATATIQNTGERTATPANQGTQAAPTRETSAIAPR